METDLCSGRCKYLVRALDDPETPEYYCARFRPCERLREDNDNFNLPIRWDTCDMPRLT